MNVLMAMDIIEKERKEKLITWRGLPSGPNTSLERLRAQKLQLTFQLERQQKYIEVSDRSALRRWDCFDLVLFLGQVHSEHMNKMEFANYRRIRFSHKHAGHASGSGLKCAAV